MYMCVRVFNFCFILYVCDGLGPVSLVCIRPYTHTHAPHTQTHHPPQNKTQTQVLIYLNDVSVGGKTHFPRLNLSVTPTKGMALVFFPATLDGRLDEWVRACVWACAWFRISKTDRSVTTSMHILMYESTPNN